MRAWLESSPDEVDLARRYREEAARVWGEERVAGLLNQAGELTENVLLMLGVESAARQQIGGGVYEQVARCWGKRVLRYFDELQASGMLSRVPRANHSWEQTDRPTVDRQLDLPPSSDLMVTGFQWGWGINAARYVYGLPDGGNPALVTLSSEEDAGDGE